MMKRSGKNYDRSNPYSGGLLEAIIISVDDDRGEMTIEFTNVVGRKTLPIASLNSGLNTSSRSHPEIGATLILAYCKNNSTIPHVIAYKNKSDLNRFRNGGQTAISTPSQYVLPEKFGDGIKIPVRKLTSGEEDNTSAGGSFSFSSIKGEKEIGSGLVLTRWSRNGLSITNEAPEFECLSTDYNDKAKTDCLRFGAVTRSSESGEKIYVEDGESIAKEFFFDLSDVNQRLVRIQHGNVIDIFGKPIIGANQNELRCLERWYTSSKTKVVREIDVKGNFTFSLPSDADIGINLNLTGSNSSLTANIGKNFNILAKANSKQSYDGELAVTSGKDWKDICGGARTISVQKDLNVTSGQALTLKSQSIISIKGSKVFIN